MNQFESVTVDTPVGPVVGRRRGGALLFAGIPYAAPPVGALRFRAAQPAAEFAEPYNATRFGPAAPQVATGGMTDSAPVRWNEDCLTLNVSTPACDTADRAVLIWIHGGGYRTGQSSIPWYAGANFARNGDIVTVSINYRLGALGFTDLSHLGSEFADSAVNGTLDQLTAIRWVVSNIRAFGGNPDRITIAGESAGGFSVATLLGCRAAQGLFQRAIAQSGGAHHTLPKSASERVTSHFLDVLGGADARALETASVEAILEAQTATIRHFEGGAGVLSQLGTTVAPFYPTHGTRLLPEAPIESIHAGVGARVALLTGTNTHETTLWGYGTVDEDKLRRIAGGLGAGALVGPYRALMPDASPEAILIAITTDHMFRVPAIRLAEARAPHTAETWSYLFNWHSRAFDGRLKATHALEIPFAFDNLDKPGVDAFVGPGPRPQHVADVMHRAWIDFVNRGDPGWPRYGDARETLVFDDTSAVADDPGAATRLLWEGIR